MTAKLLTTTLFIFLFLGSNPGYAERHKYPKLKPADPPCLFFLDEETGNPTGNAANAPCDLGGIVVNPGDTVNPALIKKHGKIKKDVKKSKDAQDHNASRSNTSSDS